MNVAREMTSRAGEKSVQIEDQGWEAQTFLAAFAPLSFDPSLSDFRGRLTARGAALLSENESLLADLQIYRRLLFKHQHQLGHWVHYQKWKMVAKKIKPLLAAKATNFVAGVDRLFAGSATQISLLRRSLQTAVGAGLYVQLVHIYSYARKFRDGILQAHRASEMLVNLTHFLALALSFSALLAHFLAWVDLLLAAVAQQLVLLLDHAGHTPASMADFVATTQGAPPGPTRILLEFTKNHPLPKIQLPVPELLMTEEEAAAAEPANPPTPTLTAPTLTRGTTPSVVGGGSPQATSRPPSSAHPTATAPPATSAKRPTAPPGLRAEEMAARVRATLAGDAGVIRLDPTTTSEKFVLPGQRRKKARRQ
jgi:hypothetical protein